MARKFISWLPMGGYVKFAGDADPSSRGDAEALRSMDAAERAGSLVADDDDMCRRVRQVVS